MSGVLALMMGNRTSGGGAGGLTVSQSDTAAYGSIAGTGTATTTPALVVTPSGGTAPYTYAWSRTGGDATTTISSATAASVTWSRNFGIVTTFTSTWVCTVTDALGATAATSAINVQLERIS